MSACTLYAASTTPETMTHRAPADRKFATTAPRLCALSGAARICHRLGIAHARLVDVDIAGLDPGPRELREDFSADHGLTDSRRIAQLQDGDQLAAHRLPVSTQRVAGAANARPVTKAMTRIVTATFPHGAGLRLSCGRAVRRDEQRVPATPPTPAVPSAYSPAVSLPT